MRRAYLAAMVCVVVLALLLCGCSAKPGKALLTLMEKDPVETHAAEVLAAVDEDAVKGLDESKLDSLVERLLEGGEDVTVLKLTDGSVDYAKQDYKALKEQYDAPADIIAAFLYMKDGSDARGDGSLFSEMAVAAEDETLSETKRAFAGDIYMSKANRDIKTFMSSEEKVSPDTFLGLINGVLCGVPELDDQILAAVQEQVSANTAAGVFEYFRLNGSESELTARTICLNFGDGVSYDYEGLFDFLDASEADDAAVAEQYAAIKAEMEPDDITGLDTWLNNVQSYINSEAGTSLVWTVATEQSVSSGAGSKEYDTYSALAVKAGEYRKCLKDEFSAQPGDNEIRLPVGVWTEAQLAEYKRTAPAADPQPMTAILVVDDDSAVRLGVYLKSNTTVTSVASSLISNLEGAGKLTFTSDPAKASVYIYYSVAYPFYQTYYYSSGSYYGRSVSTYSCKLVVTAVSASNYQSSKSITVTHTPSSTMSVSGLVTKVYMSLPGISTQANDIISFVKSLG